MRGIAGIIHFDDRPIAPDAIAGLLRQLSPGTFDRVTHACAGAAGFGHLARCTAPEDRDETQPVRSADGNLLLVTDTLLENRAELAADFGWSRAESESRPDSAFVLAAYEKWGEACAAKLDGRWALAVWHARERRLFAAVDVFSFRPFYYVRRADFFAFATTLRGLLSLPEVSREIDAGLLADWLSFARSHPGRTLYRDIQSLPAAHRLRADRGQCAVERYWRPDAGRELILGSDAEYVEAFGAEFERAVSAGLRVEGNVGILVSGGLDSAAATAVAGKLLAAQGRRLQAVHRLPPEGGPRYAPGRELDESGYVRRMQTMMPHVDFHFVPTAPAGGRVSFEDWEARFDEHCAPLRAVPFARTAADDALRALDLRRMFTGHGGNYVASLEAYPSAYFLQLATRLQWWRLGRELRGHAEFYQRTIRHLVKYRLLRPLWPAPTPDEGAWVALREYLNPDFVRESGMARHWRRPRFGWERNDFDVKRKLAWILEHLMPQNVGVCGSVIARHGRSDNHAPFMTRRLNEFCLAVPLEQQIRDGRDRLLLRRAMRGLLPEDVIWRVSRGFDAPDAWPVAHQLAGELPAALDALERSTLAARFFDLRAWRQRLGGANEAELRRLGPTRLIDLFNAAWFLRWLENHAR